MKVMECNLYFFLKLFENQISRNISHGKGYLKATDIFKLWNSRVISTIHHLEIFYLIVIKYDQVIGIIITKKETKTSYVYPWKVQDNHLN